MNELTSKGAAMGEEMRSNCMYADEVPERKLPMPVSWAMLRVVAVMALAQMLLGAVAWLIWGRA